MTTGPEYTPGKRRVSSDDLIEAVARDQQEAGLRWLDAQVDDTIGWADVPDEVFARAAVASVRRWDAERGLVTVPRKLTEEMDRRAHIAVRDAPSSGTATVRCWAEAVAAAPLPPGASETTP